MADNHRDFKVPAHLHEIAHHAEHVNADEIEPISVEESQQAFLDAEAIARRLGGSFNVGAYRVEQGQGWITAGYVFRYKPFVPAVRRAEQAPEPVEEPENGAVEAAPAAA